MPNKISLTNRLSKEKPFLEYDEVQYPVNDSVTVLFRFEELAKSGGKGAIEAVRLAIGDEACEAIDVDNLSVQNFNTLIMAIMALMQGITLEEAEKRFRKSTGSI